MLLHQRNVIERGAPRWWTLTAAASFLTLAACTAGVQLKADEPARTEDVKVIVVSDDDDKGTDKKKTETKTIRVTGKTVQGDGKTFVWTTDDGKDNPHVFKLQSDLSPDKQKALEEVLKKLDRLLEKSSKQVDDSTRTQLEELKKMLHTMKDTNKVYLLGQMEAAKDAQAAARVRLAEVLKNKEDLTKVAQAKVELAKQMAASQRDEAVAAEKLARVAQERALVRWKQAKDGDDKDAAIKELEKAIAEKERALRALKTGEANAAKSLRSFDVAPLVMSRDAVSSTGRGRLGVVTAEIDSALRGHLDLADGQGLMLNEVIDPSPAWNQGNGLRSSDILVEFAGKKVPADTEKFREVVGKLDAGTYSAVVFRKGKKMTIGGIKLPAVDKNKKVVLERDLIEAGSDHLLAVVPHLDKAAQELVVAGQLKADGLNRLKLNVSPDVKVLGEVLKKDQAGQLKDLKAQHLALELAQAQPLKGDVTIVKPLEKNITLDGVTLRVDPATIVKSGAGNTIKLHGVNTRTSVNSQPFQVVTQLANAQAQSSPKPRLGVTLEEVPDAVASQIELPEDRGLFVLEVIEGSAAQKAGILKNDILIEFADKPVSKDHSAFTKRIKDLKPGKYTATVVRKGKDIRIRGIELADVKTVTEEKKNKAKEWVVDGDSEKMKEEENDKPKVRARDSVKKEREDFFPNARGQLRFAPAQGNMSVTINDDQFTASRSNDGKTITMTGKMVNGKAEPSNIIIKNDDGEKKYRAVKDVPEEDRADVEKMLTSFKGNVFQWNGAGRFNLNNGQFNNNLFNKQLEEQMKQFEKSMKLLGDGNPGLEQMEKQLEQLRQQLKKMRGGKDDDDK